MKTPASRLGMWSAWVLFIGGVAYAIVVAVGMLSYGLDRPIGDPVLAIMEIITLLLAPFIVVLMGAIYLEAGPESKIGSLAAFGFAVLLTGVTMTVHFVQLTAGRQTGSGMIAWPSSIYAAELLAWDVFLGLALLLAAPGFRGTRLRDATRWSMLTAGTMCILGVTGPVSGMMLLQFIAVAGYGLVFPVVCLLLARGFAVHPAEP